MRKRCLLFLLSVLMFNFFLSCGGGGDDDERRIHTFVPPENLRKDASVPMENEYGVNFSVKAPNAKYVSIVGDFNNWIDNRNVMKKNKYGVWSTYIQLKKGEYAYKFNIDGVWIIDKNNPNFITDKFGDRRSIVKVKKGDKYYKEPIYTGFDRAYPPIIKDGVVTFTYKEEENEHAKRVSVAGNFNNWEKEQYYMSKNLNGIWSTTIVLTRGKYYYKFNVDGIWKPDPQNPNQVDDGFDDYKSVLEINFDSMDKPKPPVVIHYQIVRFHYYSKDLPSYIDVSVIGTFNNWQEGVKVMSDSDNDKVWYTTARLSPGEYYYRFSIEGKEFLDPENKIVKLAPDNKEASYLNIVFPPNRHNVKFSYKNDDAKNVSIVADFNNWNPEVDEMEKDEHGIWYITKFLEKGGYAYKYVVDGEWILDPLNNETRSDMNGELNSYVIVP